VETRYRWAVLAIGAGSTAAMAAAQGGLPALGPALGSTYGLSLVQVTAVFSAFGIDTVVLVLAGALVASSLAAAIWLRDPPPHRSAAPPAPPATRDRRIWRLGVASALLIVGQVGLTSLLVLFLFSERGWSAATAALALGVVQLGGAAARVIAGRWSDRTDQRIEPFRGLAAIAGALLLAAAALADAPDALLVPVLMAGGMLAMSWNGLSFTAAAEISGRAQAGRAMGLQNTLMRIAGAAAPLALGALAATLSWRVAFAVMGLAPLVGRALLGPLVADEDRRRRERRARLASA